MIWLCILFCSLLAFIGYSLHKVYFAPAVIASLVWSGILLLYVILDNPLNDLSAKVLFVIGVWALCFFTGALLFGSGAKSKVDMSLNNFDASIRTIYYYISIVGCIPLLYIAYKQGAELQVGSFWTNLRYANVHQKEMASQYQYGIWTYTYSISFVSLLIETLFHGKRKKIYILLTINILIALITASKSGFFFLTIALLFSLIYQQRLSKKTIIITMLILITLMMVLQNIRIIHKTSISETFYTYVFAGIPALDQMVTNNVHIDPPGSETFLFINNVSEKFFATSPVQKKLVPDISENGYFFVPLPTNVLTVIGPFWLDYGWGGVSIIGFLVGSFSGFLYKKMRQGFSWALIAYSYIFCILVLQSFGEYIFRTFSYTLQIMFLTWFAYKFKWILKWRK
jgi:oligosaccharide repeat unit polymerase